MKKTAEITDKALMILLTSDHMEKRRVPVFDSQTQPEEIVAALFECASLTDHGEDVFSALLDLDNSDIDIDGEDPDDFPLPIFADRKNLFKMPEEALLQIDFEEPQMMRILMSLGLIKSMLVIN